MPDTQGKVRILICEDEIIDAADLQSRLKNLGYMVCCQATTGEQALELVEQHRPDIVMMDIVLQGEMDGIDAAEVIRNKCCIPVVFITACADTDRLERASLPHPFGYILKPFQDRDLKIAVEMALYVAKCEAERRKEDELRRESEQLFSNFFFSSPIGMVITRLSDGKYIDSNDEFNRTFGYGRNETVDHTLLELEFWKKVENREKVIRALKNHRMLKDMEIEFRHRSGESRIGQISFSIIKFRNEECLFSTIIDITEQKKTMKALMEKAQRQKILMDASRDGIAIINQNHKIIDANERLAEMLHYTPEEVLNLHTWDFETVMTEDDIRNIFNDISKTCTTFETRHIRKDGTIYDAEVTASGTKVGNESLVLTITRDITQRKQLERERELLISDLQHALAEIKELRGFLPICAKCKKIRDDKGYWQQVEKYIQDRTDAKFSHSICPDCMKALYPEIADMILNETDDDG